MSNERDELAEIIRAIDGPATIGGMDIVDAILAAGYVKADPVWEPSLLNDGVHEFTTTGSCDGLESWHWKRKPRLSYDSGHFGWEKNEEPTP